MRADVYAIGAILYHLLTGSAPYDEYARRGGSQSVLMAVLREPPPAVREIAPHAPRELRAICRRAMARRKGDRYPDTGELGADLRRWLEVLPVEAASAGPWAHCTKWVQRNRGLAAMGTFAALVALVGALVAVSLEHKRSADLAEINEELTASEELARSDRDRATTRADAANLEAAVAAIELGQGRTALDRLAAIPDERRGWAWHHVDAKLATVDARTEIPPGSRTVAIAPGGGPVVTFADDHVMTHDLETGLPERTIGPLEASVRCLTVGASGSTAYAGLGNGMLIALDLTTGERRQLKHFRSPTVNRLAVDPAEEWAAVQVNRRDLYRLRLDGSGEHTLLERTRPTSRTWASSTPPG